MGSEMPADAVVESIDRIDPLSGERTETFIAFHDIFLGDGPAFLSCTGETPGDIPRDGPHQVEHMAPQDPKIFPAASGIFFPPRPEFEDFANLAVGITFSTLAKNQLQAMQMTFFFFLPSILLSGFMFPFRGMPGWAQAIGEALPLTHFLRIIRGVMLKGNDFAATAPELWPIALFAGIALIIAAVRYRQTLD